MSSLHPLHNTDGAASNLQVVFVHGLNLRGNDEHHRHTWMADPRNQQTLWPEWLVQQLGCGVWLYRYDADATRWTGDAMHILSQGTALLNALSSESRIGNQPLMLVGHSMGGLVVKYALRIAADESTSGDQRLAAALNSLKAIVFVASPHQGSHLASLAKVLRWVARTNANLVAMASNDVHLQELNRRTVGLCTRQRLQTLVFVEGHPVRMAWLGIHWPWLRTTVVSRTSSDPGLPEARPIEVAATHITIAHAANMESTVFKAVLQLAKSLLPATTPALQWPAASQTRWAQHRQQQLLQADNSLLQTRFVNLSLLPQHHAQPGALPLPVDSLQALFSRHPQERAWVLAGDPGGGKSTLVRAHELDTLKPWLQGSPPADPTQAELCLPIELRRLKAAQLPPDVDAAIVWLDAWLQQQWQRLCEAAGIAAVPQLQDLRLRARVRVLFDGLNEIDADNETQRAAAVRVWAEWLALKGSQQNWLAPVFTVRVLNYSQTLDSTEVEVRRAEVHALDSGQIQAFCTQYFKDENNPVWQALKDLDEGELKAFFGNPFNLNLQCELYSTLGRVVRQRADLLAARTWARLAELCKPHRHELAPSGPAAALLSAGDRTAINNPAQWRQLDKLWRLPDEGELIRGLDAWAYGLHMANSGAPGDATQAQACCHVSAPLQAVWWQVVLALDLVLPEQGRYKFRHHLYQEFFAARHLATLQDPAAWPSLAAPALQEKTVARWEPLPPPEASRWDQAARMAVQMGRNSLPMLRRMVDEGNLALAARAMAGLTSRPVQGGSTDAELAALRMQVQQALLARMQDPDWHLRQRLEAGLALGELGDRLRYRMHTGAGGVECLLPQPDRWVPVRPGAYPVGGFKSAPGTVHIKQAFSVAFAPVTNAEFACFLKADGYGLDGADEPPLWWPAGAEAQAFWQGKYRDDGWAETLDYWRALKPVEY